MNNVLLITPVDIKSQSNIEQNANDKILTKLILNTQEIQLRPILQDTLYNTVINAVSDNAINSTVLPDPVAAIFPLITSFLINATMVDFIVMNNYKMTNKGTLKLNDNSGNSVAANEVEYIKNYYDNYKAVYKAALIGYLKANNLTVHGSDVDVTSEAAGWLLDVPQNDCDNYYYDEIDYSCESNITNGTNGSSNGGGFLISEVDPVWEADKPGIQSQIDSKLNNSTSLQTDANFNIDGSGDLWGLLNGYTYNSAQIAYAFSNGCFVQTEINDSTVLSFELYMSGNTGGSLNPLFTIINGSTGGASTFVNLCAIAIGHAFDIQAFFYNSSLCFWVSSGEATSIHFTLVAKGAGTTQYKFILTDAIKPLSGTTGDITIVPNQLLTRELADTLYRQLSVPITWGDGLFGLLKSPKSNNKETTKKVIANKKEDGINRLTTNQKNEMQSPEEGMEVYDLTLHKKCLFTGSVWETITSN